ncbi:unnamed protein product [Penicillium salamii]|uniref:Rieske domain-containing protein n=1 Tax=Penicillium salamii TaxID=1612424 RepID=A0A9W4J2R4_9EURO|nr:unnamed protein product [Penicillium salamii]CAG8362640.1 unnamed protein product [Penicillium salamii]CAG8366066.1 unnamed protein product [Penicillium salamii]CAG8386006.1 unnamed protein product [Penicillium salamii]
MESINNILFSPSSILVALVTVAILINKAWPRVTRSKQNNKVAGYTSDPTSTQGLSVSKETEIPEGWMTDSAIFELERRGLFSQTWMYLAHSAQFTKPGMYQSFDMAGFPVFVIRGKDGKIRAFHNVCRHRAYTITRKETGASTVLGCRYHGWSYDTTGRLVKAPQFDNVPGFDKSQNSLFEIHAHTTQQGLVFVNLNAEEPSPLDDEAMSKLNGFSVASGLQPGSVWVAGQTLSADFNWKMGMKPSLLESFATELKSNLPEAFGRSTVKDAVRHIFQSNPLHESYHFPTTLFHYFVDTKFWFALSFFPASESKTHIRYDIFSHSSVGEVKTKAISAGLENASDRLKREIENDYHSVTNGQHLPAEFENQGTREALRRISEHRRLEKMQGSQIYPAMRKSKGSNLFQQAEKVCSELDCVSGGSKNGNSSTVLDW